MNPLDWILLAIRWAHALGAVAWVGGGIFYLMVLRPAFRRGDPGREVHQAIGEEFRSLVNTAIIVLVVTGAILTASRLTADNVTTAYIGVLALKIALAIYMMAVMRFRRQPAQQERDGSASASGLGRMRRALTGPTALLLIGVVIFGLADGLAYLFENSLTR